MLENRTVPNLIVLKGNDGIRMKLLKLLEDASLSGNDKLHKRFHDAMDEYRAKKAQRRITLQTGLILNPKEKGDE